MPSNQLRLEELNPEECFVLEDGRLFQVTNEPGVVVHLNQFQPQGDRVIFNPSGLGLCRFEPEKMVLKVNVRKLDAL